MGKEEKIFEELKETPLTSNGILFAMLAMMLGTSTPIPPITNIYINKE